MSLVPLTPGTSGGGALVSWGLAYGVTVVCEQLQTALHGSVPRAKIIVPMAQIPDYMKQPWPTTRQFERRPLEARLLMVAAGPHSYRGWCRDVGEGGLGATIAAPLKLGDEVSLEFELPGCSEPLRVRALLRFSDGFRQGFEFLTLTPAQRSELLAFLNPPEPKRKVRRR